MNYNSIVFVLDLFIFIFLLFNNNSYLHFIEYNLFLTIWGGGGGGGKMRKTKIMAITKTKLSWG